MHGYIVSVTSTNAAEGKDSVPVMDDPALSTDELVAIATSERWFDVD